MLGVVRLFVLSVKFRSRHRMNADQARCTDLPELPASAFRNFLYINPLCTSVLLLDQREKDLLDYHFLVSTCSM